MPKLFDVRRRVAPFTSTEPREPAQPVECAALRYLRDEVAGRAQRYLGHNPAGGLMAITLPITLLALVVAPA